ncbi:unnamed protein product [Lepeophtheirus salmonis]|uniref:(salmon louse) hypothetical protein n=1 Tax=Lepeophtheirus salmonis TaxID=72036 RepID=A0A7R8D7Q3_LEPSM|nr:unnamed protein product [Lepeophtheirus salmonis]CAF3002078.1 unnamed protein product [Lepeophtheirus salmonis]
MSIFRSGVNKFRAFGVNILSDYKEALKDVGQRFRERPIRYWSLTGVGAFTLAAFHKNPELQDFLDDHLKYNKELTVVPQPIRNPHPENFHTRIDTIINQKKIRRFNLIFLSLIYFEDHSSESGLFAAHCSYLQPSYLEIISERVIDIGFWGIWWKSRAVMEEFDVNPHEWNSDGTPTSPVSL